jgi:glycosyltransferase involved in cell wall biosynthesis
MPHIVFINRFYWPDEPATAQLLTDLAESLAGRGLEVEVLTGHPASKDSPRLERRNGVLIRRIRSSHLGRIHVLLRLLDFLRFIIGANWHVLRRMSRGDCLVAMTDPPMLGLWLWPAARLKGLRLLHYCQDIYPEVAISLSSRRWLSFALGCLRPARDFSWRHSEGVVVLGEDMAALAASRGVSPASLHIIPNWAPVGLSPAEPHAVEHLRRSWGLESHFVVMYSGNIGRVHDLEPVLDLAQRLAGHPKIMFVLVGGGAQRRVLEDKARQLRLGNLRFLPPQPRSSLAASLSVGDLHLVTLKPGCEHSVFPSKFYGIVAIGRPVFFIGPDTCELAGLIRQNELGLTFPRHELKAMTEALAALTINPSQLQKMNHAATAYHLGHGFQSSATESWQTLIQSS